MEVGDRVYFVSMPHRLGTIKKLEPHDRHPYYIVWDNAESGWYSKFYLRIYSMSFAAKLRELNKQHEEKMEVDTAAKAEAERKQDEADKAWAKAEVETVKLKCWNAAKNGEREVCYAKLDYTLSSFKDSKTPIWVSDFKYAVDKLPLSFLRGKWKYLAVECTKNELVVELLYNYDGGGRDAWYEFTVKW